MGSTAIDGIAGLRTVADLVGGDQALIGLEYDDQGWGGNHPIFRELIKLTRPKLIVEIGTWKGRSAMHMAECLEAEGLTDSRIICIDTWLGAEEFIDKPDDDPKRGLMRRMGYPQIYYQFLSNVDYRALGKYIVPLPQPSSIGLRYLRNKGLKADLIYIDGSHEYEDVRDDLDKSNYLLNRGGIVFGDDYCEYWQGVVNAVEDWAEDGLIDLSNDVFVDQIVVGHRRYENAKGDPPSDYWYGSPYYKDGIPLP